MSKKLKYISLFCGGGGSDIGVKGDFTFLEQYYNPHDMQLVYANDNDQKACNLFEDNFNFTVDRRNIEDVPVEEIPAHDVLLGGFPCQSFSILAQNPPRLGFKNDKGKLFSYITKILMYHKPKYFICENVKGLLSANEGKALPLILSEFEKAGYSVSFKILNAKNFGVPQKRERVFIVGIRKDIKKRYLFPDQTHKDNFIPLKRVLQKNFKRKYYFSDKAVEGMLKANRFSKVSMNKGRDQDREEPCNTVTAHLAKVTLNGTDPVLKINDQYRRFTPREVARIQSFPEEYRLIGSDSALYRALGNAIPPVLMWHVVKNLIALETCKSSKDFNCVNAEK
jgi:DNA (cytosine-5)-methyltransferase 1